VKKLTLVVAMTVAALFWGAAPARAESGQLLAGLRIAYNYSNIFYDDLYYNYNDGGHGIELGLVGRYAVVESQVGIHLGVNYIYREPFYFNEKNRAHEQTVSVPLLFEINPFVLGGLNSLYYEMIFFQFGVQADYVFEFMEKNSYSYVAWDREKTNVGLVIGAVGYFNSHSSLDLRYNYGITRFVKDEKSYLYSGSLGLSIYF